MSRKVYTDFAWECLRRNPLYISDWKIAKEKEADSKNEISDETLITQNILDLNAERKWGLMKYVEPDISDPIDVFWSPRLSKRSIRLALSTSGNFTWGNIANKPGVHQNKLRLMDHTLCVKIFNKNNYFQFFSDSNLILNDNMSLFLYIPFTLQADSINKSIDIINSIISNQYETDEKEKRHFDLLKIIDNRKQGLTHRDIASELFGEERVKSEWSSDSWLRANIRYRLKKANNLINNGYLDYI
ncbi:DNA -binding domain-containing protein [Serratia sp. UGAL515B_01]|uniref:DNA -binding domain-containing protein n=1 Tax=Serratia sp. UGAL515B_01 TaxID=2986763 RepID=UPI002955DD09|nr:DUF2285 domain-containing protein [Serratia sp. UGAL515B_01]WON77451.1 DUF2285 domain-containing protein [Serratia sp. UGAL515B_01]